MPPKHQTWILVAARFRSHSTRMAFENGSNKMKIWFRSIFGFVSFSSTVHHREHQSEARIRRKVITLSLLFNLTSLIQFPPVEISTHRSPIFSSEIIFTTSRASISLTSTSIISLNSPTGLQPSLLLLWAEHRCSAGYRIFVTSPLSSLSNDIPLAIFPVLASQFTFLHRENSTNLGPW